MNIDTHEIKPLDQLTPEERASGRWKEIPSDTGPKNKTRETERRQRQDDHARRPANVIR